MIAGQARQFSGQIPIDQAYKICFDEVSDEYIEYIYEKAWQDKGLIEWLENFDMYEFFNKP